MNSTHSTGILTRLLGYLDIFGPIFEKELRTASRQKKIFALRSIYLLILTAVIYCAWIANFRAFASANVYNMSQMSQIGLTLLSTIGIFQFIALQLIAPVLTCTAISDEINASTLGTLMMTPITSFQIVAGKLFSKLLTMLLLLLISLPLLTVVRVFGGIEWNLILKLLAMTISSALFAAAVSLTFSIFHKKAYAAIIMTYITLISLYFVFPLLLAYSSIISAGKSLYYGSILNPFSSLTMLISEAFNPGLSRPAAFSMIEPLHQCILLLVLTFILLIFCSIIVRYIALHLAAGENVYKPRSKQKTTSTNDSHDPDLFVTRRTRTLSGNPVLWKEVHTPLIASRRSQVILILFTIAALIFTYAKTWSESNQEYFHTLYTLVFMLISLIVAGIFSAITITGEKEAATFEVLLTTPLTARQIVYGKAMGVVKHLWAVFILFFVHIAFFVTTGQVHPLALLYSILLLPAPVVFLIATGTYFTACVKRTATAVILNLLTGIFLWAVFPFLSAFFGFLTRGNRLSLFDFSLNSNPIALNMFTFASLTEDHYFRTIENLSFRLSTGTHYNWLEFTFLLLAVSTIYTILAAFIFQLAVWKINDSRRQ